MRGRIPALSTLTANTDLPLSYAESYGALCAAIDGLPGLSSLKAAKPLRSDTVRLDVSVAESVESLASLTMLSWVVWEYGFRHAAGETSSAALTLCYNHEADEPANVAHLCATLEIAAPAKLDSLCELIQEARARAVVHPMKNRGNGRTAGR
jgi:hypothetical protein